MNNSTPSDSQEELEKIFALARNVTMSGARFTQFGQDKFENDIRDYIQANYTLNESKPIHCCKCCGYLCQQGHPEMLCEEHSTTSKKPTEVDSLLLGVQSSSKDDNYILSNLESSVAHISPYNSNASSTHGSAGSNFPDNHNKIVPDTNKSGGEDLDAILCEMQGYIDDDDLQTLAREEAKQAILKSYVSRAEVAQIIEPKNIKEIRKQLKLSQLDMAAFLGVSRMTLFTWEKNVENMPLGKYMKLVTEYERLNKLNLTEELK